MPATKTITTYKFDELSDQAKEKARDWFREGHLDDNSWAESVIEEAVREGELMGIDFQMRNVPLCGGGTRQEPCIWWSGFYAQGSGACFEGTWRARDAKVEKVAEDWGDSPQTTEIKRIAAEFGRISKQYPAASFKVIQRGHYSHSHCTEFDVDLGEDQEDSDPAALIEAARDFMDYIYDQLQKEYEYRMSAEAVDEDLRANDYDFTKSGSRKVVL